MKHIGILVPSFPVASETFVVTEINALVASGHQVTVVTFENVGECDALSPEVTVIEVEKLSRAELLLGVFNIPRLVRGISSATKMKSIATSSLVAYGYSIANIIKHRRIDHLHCHFMHGSLAYGIVGAKLAHITVSSIGHGHDVYVNQSDIPQKLSLCDFSVAVCQDMANQFSRYTHSKVKLLHCGINLERFNQAPTGAYNDVKLLFIGRLVEKKGLHFLMPALKNTLLTHHITLDIVGDGPLMNDLKFMVEALGITNNVNFLGRKPPTWIADNTKNYSALVAPFCIAKNGDRDTGPLVLKEAMGSGIAVLTTELMGAKEIVNQKVGMKCKPSDIMDLTRMLSQFCDFSPYQRFTMGQNGKRFVTKHFNAKAQAEKLSGWVQAL
ncbi:colanic acid biosynthesis glycosyltransferase WcaL [Pseudoalteromonas citrea]|uniref:Colanic acid biosynthesis glycosyltransferase WcaL n=1 Tax=Pseudoalteromonas citrea TaxID=43655 RepID=A0A5S3XUM1_9GAMM|nr:glycosyltransferase [Pseudoalteromonas citrea]TMP42147.1 colanic acid biosynthesis glycosyltransferase WcaL [Pseudoalteromonas citrea]TMP62383.1 colanic acid biosynthesis glycosyltransferase WcaL [Pseudoalteromonas citrea]